MAITLATLLIVDEIIWLIYSWRVLDARVVDLLPLHLCDLSVIATILGLLTRRQYIFEFAYFFGLGGAMQALLTPDLAKPFPAYPTLKFFVSHGGIFLGVIFMVSVYRLRPYPVSVLRMIGAAFAYTGIVGFIDWVLDVNYGYFCARPANPSLLDHLGPWPWYILAALCVASVVMVILYVPFFIYDVRRRRSGTHHEHPPVP